MPGRTLAAGTASRYPAHCSRGGNSDRAVSTSWQPYLLARWRESTSPTSPRPPVISTVSPVRTGRLAWPGSSIGKGS
jgi:hypothetical protein